MLKTLFILGIIACIFFSSATKSIIRISYEINKLEIVQRFCVNKEVKEFKCDGKCYLKSQLDKADQENEDVPTIEDHKIQLFQIAFRSHEINPVSSKLTFSELQVNLKERFPKPILRPPIA